MALTENYVDPAIAGNSGSGAIGDPYGDLQWALDNIVRDAVNGDRINIKAGTDEILAAVLDFSTYGSPSYAAPLVLQGYTIAAGDGGIGGINGDGNHSIYSASALDLTQFIDLHLHNSGLTRTLLSVDNFCSFINCEFDVGKYVLCDAGTVVINCHFHNMGTYPLVVEAGSFVAFNTFEYSGGYVCVASSAGGATFLHNVMILSGGASGIQLGSYGQGVAIGNSVFSTGGTGIGISATGGYNGQVIVGNIVEGFSGVGGKGIVLGAGGVVTLYGHNAFYNNTTNLADDGDILIDLRANDQVLVASPFTDAPNDDFTVKTTVAALAYPTANFPNLAVRSYLDIGALQRQETGGGGGGRRGRIRHHGV